MDPTDPPSPGLRDLVFRTSDRYELVLHDRLRPEEARRFAPLRRDPDHWGVLRPRGAGNYRAVDRETALLLFTLRRPGPLPSYAVDVLGATGDIGSGAGAALDRTIRKLVLDGVLEAETRDGRPVERLGGGPGPIAGPTAGAGVDSPSLAALRYGAALTDLGVTDTRDLAIRLYLYGGEPLTREVCDRLATRRQALDFLGLAPGGEVRRLVPASWRVDAGGEAGGDSGWIYLRRDPRRDDVSDASGVAAGAAAGRGACKLYVACRLADVRRALGAVVRTLGTGRARSMKVGPSAVDLARADKIVVYFASFEDLQPFAAQLAVRFEELGLVPGDGAAGANGVPFTAPAGAGGLLTWGVDPPAESLPLEGTFERSWRAWVTSRVAAALVSISRSPSGHGELDAVLERVRLDGVDVERWTPDADLWRST